MQLSISTTRDPFLIPPLEHSTSSPFQGIYKYTRSLTLAKFIISPQHLYCSTYQILTEVLLHALSYIGSNLPVPEQCPSDELASCMSRFVFLYIFILHYVCIANIFIIYELDPTSLAAPGFLRGTSCLTLYSGPYIGTNQTP